MSGTASLAAEELRRFVSGLRNVMALADQLAGMEDPKVMQANIDRLKAQSTELIANYRAQGQKEAEAALKGEREAHERKVKAANERIEQERADIIRKAQAEASRIISDAQKQANELQARVQKAHAAAQEAMR